MSAIFQAIAARDAERVKELLESNQGIPVETNPFGDTPLHEAIRHGQEEIASLLIDAGADVNATGEFGKTPLHYAAEAEGPASLAELLIENGADVEKPNKGGETPLYMAAGHNHEVANLLLQHGAYFDLNSAVLLNRLDRINQIYEEDPHLTRVAFPQLLLAHAAQVDSTEAVQALLRHGIKPDCFALIKAIESALNRPGSTFDILQLMLENGGDPKCKFQNLSPLEYAKQFQGKRAKQVVRLLTQHAEPDDTE